jgi:hypothetical protein
VKECQRCKQLESIVLKQAKLIRELQRRIGELERMLGLRDELDDDSGGSGYLEKVKAKKPGKQFGKKKIKKRPTESVIRILLL